MVFWTQGKGMQDQLISRGKAMHGVFPLYLQPWEWTRLLVPIRVSQDKTSVEIQTHYAR